MPGSPPTTPVDSAQARDTGLNPAGPLTVAALVKQVPVAESLGLDASGRLRREGTAQEMNAYCRRAVSKGVEIARVSGGTCSVFTLGPPSAEEVLREAVAWGADRAVHVCDPAFAGSDTLATARALAAALASEGPFDLILVGRNTIDGDTGQVGPQLAQLLGLPFATGVREMGLSGSSLLLTLEYDDGWEEAEMGLPALLSVAERLTEPAKVPPEGRAAVDPSCIRRLAASDLGAGPWGQEGSPTRVGAVHLHEHAREQRRLDGLPREQVAVALEILEERGALDQRAPGVGDSSPAVGGSAPPEGILERTIVVLVEPLREQVAAELIAAAACLLPGTARVVAYRAPGAGPEGLGALGADEVVELEGSTHPADIARDLAAWCRSSSPWLVLAPSTAFGREVAARTAAEIGAGLVGDAIGLRVDGDRVIAAKPAFSGRLVADISCDSPVQMATVRPGVLNTSPTFTRRATRTTRRVKALSPMRITRSYRDDDVELLARSTRVVGIGAGVDPDEYPKLDELTVALGAELAATRKVTDKGWMTRARQVGLTGRSIAPVLYVAIALSGKFNHTVGVRSAETVLAVNSDPDALIFGSCDVGIVGDWREVVPILTEAIVNRIPPLT